MHHFSSLLLLVVIQVHAGSRVLALTVIYFPCLLRSRLSATRADEARRAVLEFFRAPPGYTVIFTANASGALKLVGESFPFTSGSTYILGADSHNSVHGIRQFAQARGGQVCYLESTDVGGVDVAEAKVTYTNPRVPSLRAPADRYPVISLWGALVSQAVLAHHRPRGGRAPPSLFALTGQSNISNTKNPLSLIEFAASQGYSTLLDAAALAPTSVISLADTPVDAMAISFYKMFGFPTGVGALVAKESFLAQLERPWFAGGTVDVVQAPGKIVTLAAEMHERFEVRVSVCATYLLHFGSWPHFESPWSCRDHVSLTLNSRIPGRHN